MKGILAILMASIMVATMIAPAMSENAETSANVGNVAPSVCTKWEEPDDDSVTDGTQVMPNACPDDKTVTIYACVRDDNGNDDIASVTATVTGPGATPPTWNVNLARDTTVDASCDTGCIGYSGTFDMTCCDPAGLYTVVVTVTDQSGSTGTAENTFEYLSLVAMTAGDVSFGNVAPGGASTASSTVASTGNAVIEFVDAAPANYDDPDDNDGISWTNMISGLNVIDDGQITTAWTPGTTITCGNTADVPFTLSVPAGTASGLYTGTVVFTPTEVP